MEALPGPVAEALSRAGDVDDVAAKLTDARDFFFLGRHVGYPVALEGALKLKELAYLRAEGYPAGELKHGPIALIEPGTVVVGIATRNPLWEKMLSNIAEVHSRGATVVLVADDGDEEAAAVADHVLWVPPTYPLLAPVVGVVPLQLLAYRLARLHGHDADRPAQPGQDGDGRVSPIAGGASSASGSTRSTSPASAACWTAGPASPPAASPRPSSRRGAARRTCPGLAARFAAKEAVMKALGTGHRRLRLDRRRGVPDAGTGATRNAPYVVLHGVRPSWPGAQGAGRFHLSLTHTDDVAIAFVVAEHHQTQTPTPMPCAPS